MGSRFGSARARVVKDCQFARRVVGWGFVGLCSIKMWRGLSALLLGRQGLSACGRRGSDCRAWAEAASGPDCRPRGGKGEQVVACQIRGGPDGDAGRVGLS